MKVSLRKGLLAEIGRWVGDNQIGMEKGEFPEKRACAKICYLAFLMRNFIKTLCVFLECSFSKMIR